MDKQTVSFRMNSSELDALDGLAEILDRDRTYLLNEAVRNYLEVQQWQLEHIQEGIRQADAGQTVSHAEVRKMAAKWRRR
jgi:RHH-type rel operon transcriptional repressor/antitoxin RelB